MPCGGRPSAVQHIASAEDIDKVVKYGFGARMPFIGPLETADLAGLVLTRDIHKYLFPYLDSATEPAAILGKLISEGATGVRAGREFYDWSPEKIAGVIQKRDTALLRILYEIIGGEARLETAIQFLSADGRSGNEADEVELMTDFPVSSSFMALPTRAFFSSFRRGLPWSSG